MVLKKCFSGFLISGLLVLFVAGCKVGPNYKRPDIDTGSEYRFSGSGDSTSFADTTWTFVFRDTVLQKLIWQGLSYNFDLRMAIERVNQARSAFKYTRAEIWPSLDVSGNTAYQKQQTPPSGTIEYHDFYSAANLTWEIDIWGKLRRAKESARADMLAQEAYRQSVYISLIANIASGYFSLLEYRDEFQITLFNVTIREEALALVKAKLIAGTVSGLVVAQAEAELARLKTAIPAYEKTIGSQENALRLLVGQLPGVIVEGDSITHQMSPAVIPEAGIPSQLITRRPDIIQAEQELISANAQIGVARAYMLPSLSISANIGYSQLGAGIIGSAIGNLVAPIFSWGKLKANVRKTQAFKEEMLLNYQKTIYTAIGEVANGILDIEKQKEVVTEDKNLVAAAQTAFDLSNQLFNAGYASYLDVIDAQRNLYDAQVELSNAQTDELHAVVNLYLALGGGWR
ncbi:MAG: efflux transporter outer membrane subunit [Bacteroidales bacterium]|nr:efflux transporter outer membrane subunit [Bacteroidota bacterium]MBL6949721.1 efflux transporter outer membrane subunit [Bacteroidales bacterium]